jgi:uncharacterized membrane protein
MAQTIYATFPDPSLAEKAAGALLDHGARNEDISLISRDHRDEQRNRENADYAADAGRSDYVAHSATLDERRADTADQRTYHTNMPAPQRDFGSAPAPFGGIAADDPYSVPVRHPGDMDTAYTADDTLDTPRPAVDDTYVRPVGYAADRGADMVDSPSDSNTTYVNHTTGQGDKAEVAAKQGLSTTTPADAAVGAAKGAGWGLGIGIIAGLAAIFVPPLGLVAGGGALATAIAAMAATTAAGAIAGGVYGYLVDQGVPEHVAKAYNEAYERGHAVLSVTVPSGDLDEMTARQMLEKYGAENVNTYSLDAMAA